MININLLPYHLRPIKRTPLPYLAVLIVWIVALAAMFINYMGTEGKISEEQLALAYNETELTKLGDVIEQFQKLQADKALLADKINTINEIVSDRIVWSRQLWNLSRLAPNNLWFTNIVVGTDKFIEERTTINPKTKKPETKPITIEKPVLNVEGYVVESEEMSKGVYPFMDATEEDEEFRDMFQLIDVDWTQEVLDGIEVKNFELQYLITLGGAS